MKYPVFLAAAAAVLLVTAGCSANSTSSPPSARGGSSAAQSTTGAGDSARFCSLARSIGHSDLGVSSGNEAPDTKKLLGQVDQLDALAPGDLRHDFDTFTAFEHSVLDPGSGSAPVQGDPTPALKHVASYFADTCHVS